MIKIERDAGEYILSGVRTNRNGDTISILVDTPQGNPKSGWPCAEVQLDTRSATRLIHDLARELLERGS